MKINKTKCDGCGKETADELDEIGWITIETMSGSFKFAIRNGRSKEGTSQNRLWKSDIARLDFCKPECFLAWLGYAQSTKELASTTRGAELPDIPGAANCTLGSSPVLTKEVQEALNNAAIGPGVPHL